MMGKSSRQKEFCTLAYTKAIERGLANKHPCSRKIGISPGRWVEITNGDIPDFSKMSRRAIGGWVQSITRVCDFLDLDLTHSLQMLGLPADPVAMQNARALRTGEIEIGIPEVEKLRGLIELTGKPVTLLFAENFLRRLHVEK